jgi:hypothetical protein
VFSPSSSFSEKGRIWFISPSAGRDFGMENPTLLSGLLPEDRLYFLRDRHSAQARATVIRPLTIRPASTHSPLDKTSAAAQPMPIGRSAHSILGPGSSLLLRSVTIPSLLFYPTDCNRGKGKMQLKKPPSFSFFLYSVLNFDENLVIAPSSVI